MTFEAVFTGADGIGGYKPTVSTEHVFSFDGSSTGCRDHLFCYTSGSGRCWLIRHYEDGSFAPIYWNNSAGIAGFDFSQYVDRAIAYDYNHTGKMDHVLCWRPGYGAVYILEHDGNGNFTPVYKQAPTATYGPSGGNGIGGATLRWQWERIFAFDFERIYCMFLSGIFENICLRSLRSENSTEPG